MKKCLLFFSVVLLFGLKPMDKTLTPEERSFAIQFMVTTRDTLLMDVKGLTAAQQNVVII